MFLNDKNVYISTLDISEFYMFLKQIEFGEIVDDDIIENLKKSYEFFKASSIGIKLEDTFEEHVDNIKKTFENELKKRRRN